MSERDEKEWCRWRMHSSIIQVLNETQMIKIRDCSSSSNLAIDRVV